MSWDFQRRLVSRIDKFFAKLLEKFLYASDCALMALDFARPALLESILNHVEFPHSPCPQSGGVLGRGHKFRAGEIEVALARAFLRQP